MMPATQAMVSHRIAPLRLRVLITNLELDARSGTTVYVEDLALELKRQGHEPLVYTKRLGDVSHVLKDAGITVTRHLRDIKDPPDVIHGHHWHVAGAALRRFPRTPAIYICHDHTAFIDGAAFHPHIRHYFGVSQLCVDRLKRQGIAASRIHLLHNFVDTTRFAARSRLPPNPRRALVFSNYANASTHLPAVAAACKQAGLALDVFGRAAGNAVSKPDLYLGEYDLVFAKGKAAIEAMATGAAVVLCDYGGVGPMVTRENYQDLKPFNFGFQALTAPLSVQSVAQQMRRYDPVEAAHVCALLRADAGLEQAVKLLCQRYRDAIDSAPVDFAARADARTEFGATLRTTALVAWLGLPAGVKKLLGSTPGFRVAKKLGWKWLNSQPRIALTDDRCRP